MQEYYRKRNETSIEEEKLQEPETAQGQTRAYDEGWSRNKEEYHDVREAFFALPGEDRMILSMHLILGYKTREIAKLLHMNENTVRSRESRAIQKMGSKLSNLR